MRTAILLFVAAAYSTAADPDAARKLLDGAVEMAPGVHPETGVAALMRAGIAYGSFDKKTGLATLNRAFAAASALTEAEIREEYASGIVRAAADIDVRSATELLRQLPKPAPAATAVVRQLLGEKRYDDAMELLALLPADVEYPYDAASHVIAYLPQEDPRRPISFGRAVSAFERSPAGPFPVMMERFGKQMPSELRVRALSAMLRRIETWKDANNSFGGNADGDDEIELHSPQQRELHELVSVARMFDAAAVDRIVSQRADLGVALAGFRKKRKPVEQIEVEPTKKDDDDDGPFSPPFGIGSGDSMDSFRKAIDDYSKAEKQAQKVNDALKKDDAAEAVRLAGKLPELIRAEALAVIASAMLKKDPALATSVLESCVGEIERVSEPGSRIPALVKIGGVFVKLKDDARAVAAYERALADGALLWAKDTRAVRPNVASRDTWPSTQAVRMTVYEAAVNLGVKAETLLAGITVADLAVLARVQMARGLLGLPIDIHDINVRWVDSEK